MTGHSIAGRAMTGRIAAGDLDADKGRLRAEAKRRRAAAAAASPGAAAAVCRILRKAVPVPSGAVVSAYWPMGSELDPRPLMAALGDDGHPLALPWWRHRKRH